MIFIIDKDGYDCSWGKTLAEAMKQHEDNGYAIDGCKVYSGAEKELVWTLKDKKQSIIKPPVKKPTKSIK